MRLQSSSTCSELEIHFECVIEPCYLEKATSPLRISGIFGTDIRCLTDTILINPTSTISAIQNGFTHGEIILSIFGFLIVIILAYQFFWRIVHEKIDKSK